ASGRRASGRRSAAGALGPVRPGQAHVSSTDIDVLRVTRDARHAKRRVIQSKSATENELGRSGRQQLETFPPLWLREAFLADPIQSTSPYSAGHAPGGACGEE